SAGESPLRPFFVEGGGPRSVVQGGPVDTPESPRRSRSRGLRSTCVVLLLIVAAGGWALHGSLNDAERTLDHQRALLAAERERLSRASRGRPAVLEPTREGDAADVLEKFLAAAERIPKAERDRLEVSTEAFPAAAGALVEAHPELIAAIE